MSEREVYTFSPGPCIFPLEVLKKTQLELLKNNNKLFNMPPNSLAATQLISDCRALIKNLLNVPDNFEILFMQGGATFQFTATALNLLSNSEDKGGYIITGTWSFSALKEAKRFTNVVPMNSNSKSSDWTSCIEIDIKETKDLKYLYYCDNETVHGVEYSLPPQSGNTLLVTDMTSNFLSKPIDFIKYGLVYAGAQKNWGPSGLCTVIIRKSILDKCEVNKNKALTNPYDYTMYRENKPSTGVEPLFALQFAKMNLEWIKNEGGMTKMNENAKTKSKLIYDVIDSSGGFYKNPVSKNSRSRMNVIFTIKNNDVQLTNNFIKESKQVGLLQLGGHRSVGGLRASLYNGMPLQGVLKLKNFMIEFQKKYQAIPKL